MFRIALACAIGSTLLAACGARSGTEEATSTDASPTDASPTDASPTDAALADRAVADASVPTRAWGIWRFHTIRALCDTFAVAFCDDGQVFVRLSFDDLCDGSNPVGERPSLATARWTSPRDVTLDFNVGGQRHTAMLRLIEGAVPDEDHFELTAWDGDLAGFPWHRGVREETMSPPLPAGFISCN